jgi:hypothetical protein
MFACLDPQALRHAGLPAQLTSDCLASSGPLPALLSLCLVLPSQPLVSPIHRLCPSFYLLGGSWTLTLAFLPPHTGWSSC